MAGSAEGAAGDAAGIGVTHGVTGAGGTNGVTEVIGADGTAGVTGGAGSGFRANSYSTTLFRNHAKYTT